MSDVQPILEDLQIIFKSAIGPSSEPITLSAGTIKHLCERIAKAEAECNRLGQGQILLADEVAELEAENARLKAPVSDEEWGAYQDVQPTLRPFGYSFGGEPTELLKTMDRIDVNRLLAGRSITPQAKENK